MEIRFILLGCVSATLLLLLRVYLLLPSHNAPRTKRRDGETCSLGVFLGSGGHTSEMRTLVSSLDFNRYTPRTYIVCHGDDMSLRTIQTIEQSPNVSSSSSSLRGPPSNLILLPRARRVGQRPLSTLFSTLRTVLITFYHTFLLPLLHHPTRPFVDVLLINGPGTCVVLVVITWIRRILGLRYTKVIYVESFARVASLSLSAKLLRPFVDTFVVQWPDAAGKGSLADGRVTYRGWLV